MVSEVDFTIYLHAFNKLTIFLEIDEVLDDIVEELRVLCSQLLGSRVKFFD